MFLAQSNYSIRDRPYHWVGLCFQCYASKSPGLSAHQFPYPQQLSHTFHRRLPSCTFLVGLRPWVGVPPFPHRCRALSANASRINIKIGTFSLCSHIQLKVPVPPAASLPGGLAVRGGNHTGPQPTRGVKGGIHQPFVLGCESMLLNHRAGLPPARPL